MSHLVKLKCAAVGAPHHLLGGCTQLHAHWPQPAAPAAAAAHSRAISGASVAHARTLHTQRTLYTDAVRSDGAGCGLVAPASASWSRTRAGGSSGSGSGVLLLGLAGGLAGLLTFTHTHTAEAAGEASALAALPSIPFDDVSAPTAAASSPSAHTRGAAAPRKKKKARADKRAPLPYPGKLSNLDRDQRTLLAVQVTQGVRMQFPLTAFPPDMESGRDADKSCVIIPIVEMGGPNGSMGQLVVQTALGRAHHFEAYTDTAGNRQGSYKFAGERFVSKTQASVSPHGNSFSFEVDRKGAECATTLLLAQPTSMPDITLSHSQALTPSIIGGISFHTVLGAMAHLNGGLKYTRKNSDEVFTLLKQDTKFSASWLHKLFDHPHPAAAQGFPPIQTHVCVETNYSSTSKKSEINLGLRHNRHTYSYQAGYNTSSGGLSVAVDSEVAGMPNMRWGLNGQVMYDGSGQSVFGISFMAQL